MPTFITFDTDPGVAHMMPEIPDDITIDPGEPIYARCGAGFLPIQISVVAERAVDPMCPNCEVAVGAPL